MATKKTTKKPTAKKPVKKTTAKKTTSRSSAPKIVRMAPRQRIESFKVARPSSPFLTIAITRQTLYWSIIAVAVLILGLWIIHLQNKVNAIYDAIDASNALNGTYVLPEHTR